MTADASLQRTGVPRLVDVMDRLRRTCEWESEQTHASLAEYLVEETYELLEAIDTGDRQHIREELGDVLLQVVFHCRIAMEDPAAPFDIDDVAEDAAAKIVRRSSPHVFDRQLPGAPDPVSHWETAKAAEKGRRGPLDGVPDALPALAAVGKIRYRAAMSGVQHAVAPPRAEPDADPLDAFGDDLLRQVLHAADAGIDADRALRGAVRRARARVERAAAEQPEPSVRRVGAP